MLSYLSIYLYMLLYLSIYLSMLSYLSIYLSMLSLTRRKGCIYIFIYVTLTRRKGCIYLLIYLFMLSLTKKKGRNKSMLSYSSIYLSMLSLKIEQVILAIADVVRFDVIHFPPRGAIKASNWFH